MISTSLIPVIFGLSGLGALVILYPFLLCMRAVFFPRAVCKQTGYQPDVCVIIVARNAARMVEKKINNILRQDYPSGKIQIILYSDGSTDGTDRVMSSLISDRIHLIHHLDHLGKIHGMNQALKKCREPIVIFSDIDAMIPETAVSSLVSILSDPEVGGVCAKRKIRSGPNGGLSQAQGHYFRLDNFIKRLENIGGSITSCDGKLYAIRRELIDAPIPEGVTDDHYTALGVVWHGYRLVFAKDIAATIPTPSISTRHELLRRRRIVSQSCKTLWLRRPLLNPVKYGFFAIGLWLNKVFRRMMPFFLIAFFLGLAGWVWTAAILKIRFFIIPITAIIVISFFFPISRKIVSFGRYVIIGNIGTLLGIWDFLMGRTPNRWDPEKETDENRSAVEYKTTAPKPSVAYLMSRFPKITETFILYEILALMEKGVNVGIYPLIRESQSVQHPEVSRVMPNVTYTAYMNGPILTANIACFIKKPARYLGILRETLSGTISSPGIFIRTLAIFPKTVWMAQQIEKNHIGHVHAHFATHPAMSAYIIHRLTGIPYSFTAHAHDIQINRLFLKEKLQSAAFVVTISGYNRNVLKSYRNGQRHPRIHVVRCGIDPAFFHPVKTEPPLAPFTLVCVASFKDMKGHTYLVSACRILKDRGCRFVCRLIGDGPLRQTIKDQIKSLGLDRIVIDHGPLTRPDVMAYLQKTHAFVLPSVVGKRGDMEGIPVALMEAMASGKPVISTLISGIPELVGNNVSGMLVKPGDPAALADAMERLYRDADLRRRMGIAGREKVIADFHLEKNTRQLASLFQVTS